MVKLYAKVGPPAARPDLCLITLLITHKPGETRVLDHTEFVGANGVDHRQAKKDTEFRQGLGAHALTA